ncbi:MAG: hypothetical protein LBO05_05615 [Deltaproteobacteria bacterium]|nr:hypothetical protein [Deltaproteobacteria bacterium]
MPIFEPAGGKKYSEPAGMAPASERLAGMAEGLVQGEVQGRVERDNEKTIEIVTNILKSGAMTPSQIAAVYGMKEDEILALQAELGL